MISREFFSVRLAPFRNKNFNLIFAAQGVSLIGSWMQELAKSWVVMSLVGSASAMGALLFAAAVPNLIFAGIGGTMADTRSVKKILIVTQVLLSTIAFFLGLLVSGGHIQFWHLIVFAVLEGSVVAFDIPAFNIVTPQIVSKADFQQALALNSVNLHLSRFIGPSLAGLVMAFGGASFVFWINAVSFMAVVWAVSRLPLKPSMHHSHKVSSRAAFKEVWQYLWKHPVLSRVLLQFGLLMAIVFPLVFTTLRLFIKEQFHLDAQHFGLVFSMPGLGALLGSLLFLFSSPKDPLKLLGIGLVGVVLFLVGIAQSSSLPLTVVLLALFSVAMFLTIGSLVVTIQLTVDNKIRGRVSSIVSLAFMALAPCMSVPMGALSDLVGPRPLLLSVAILFAVGSWSLGVFRETGLRAPPAQDPPSTSLLS